VKISAGYCSSGAPLNNYTVQRDKDPDRLLGGFGHNWFLSDTDDTINNGTGTKEGDFLIDV